MAKFTLNCEFDSVEELRDFLQAGGAESVLPECAGGCSSGVVYEDTSKPAETQAEEVPKRRRRTKAEMAAALEAVKQDAEEVVEEKPVQREEAVRVVAEETISVIPAGEPIQPAQAAPSVLNLNLGAGIAPNPTIAPNLPSFSLGTTPQINIPVQNIDQPAITPASNGLPADLLSALGGIVPPAA